MRQVALQIGMERRIGLRRGVGTLDLQDQRHQRLGDEAPAIAAEPAARVRTAAQSVGAWGGRMIVPWAFLLAGHGWLVQDLDAFDTGFPSPGAS